MPDHAYDRPDIGPVDFMVEVMRDRTLTIYDRMHAARHLIELCHHIPAHNLFNSMNLTREDIEALAKTIERWTHEIVVNDRRDREFDMEVKGHG
jgi:hypothetical protein